MTGVQTCALPISRDGETRFVEVRVAAAAAQRLAGRKRPAGDQMAAGDEAEVGVLVAKPGGGVHHDEVGDQQQLPPMVSAVKREGVPLYKLARQGIEVHREPRLVHIYNFRFTSYDAPYAFFRVACTKGTYVRSLAHDLGAKLGCGAHLATLRRLASGKYDVADAIQYEELLRLERPDLAKRVLPFLKLVG